MLIKSVAITTHIEVRKCTPLPIFPFLSFFLSRVCLFAHGPPILIAEPIIFVLFFSPFDKITTNEFKQIRIEKTYIIQIVYICQYVICSNKQCSVYPVNVGKIFFLENSKCRKKRGETTRSDIRCVFFLLTCICHVHDEIGVFFAVQRFNIIEFYIKILMHNVWFVYIVLCVIYTMNIQ